jgi:D-3-phosphoglycerate dehydrogenase / 2-oxoglutarate reductase
VKPTVVIAYTGFGDIELEKKILSQIDAETIHSENLRSPQALEAVKQADAVMVTLEKVTSEIIGSMERCRIISRLGTGLDTIDIPAATARGIWVTYVPDYSIDEVSAHAIALMMSLARGIPFLSQATRNGTWNSAAWGPIYRLKDQTLGILGLGRIGQATAEKGRGLGLNVIAHDPYANQEVADRLGVRLVDLPTLTRESDYISLHSPLLDSTHHIVNAGFLAQMKPTAYIINAARGPLVDEDALLEAVRSGTIAGAGLDVLAVEPIDPDNPLLKEDRILITPHAAWYSEQAKLDMRTRGAEEVVRILSGQPPRSPANKVA